MQSNINNQVAVREPLVCVGDLMTECILPLSSLPGRSKTVIVDGVRWEVGGPAFNTCWYLRRLGWAVKLVAPYGLNNDPLVKEALATARLDKSSLLPVDGDTDSLLTVWTGDSHRSIYVRGALPRRIARLLSAKCHKAQQLIIAGSRHKVIRRTIINLITSQDIAVLGFNPSYAVYEYQPSELARILSRAQVTILNEEECEHVRKVRGLRRNEELARHVAGILIITRGRKGAKVYRHSLVTELGSVARKAAFPIGAGDAFFSGFLHMFLSKAPVKEAARFAAATAGLVVESRDVRVDVSERDILRKLGAIPPENLKDDL